jgi:hypothetical protein
MNLGIIRSLEQKLWEKLDTKQIRTYILTNYTCYVTRAMLGT